MSSSSQQSQKLQKPHLFYFSNQCKFCQQLMGLLSKDADLHGSFDMVNVQQRGIRLPAGVRSVPAILVNRKDLKIGKACFAWVDEMLKGSVVSFEQSADNFSTFAGSDQNFGKIGDTTAGKSHFSSFDSFGGGGGNKNLPVQPRANASSGRGNKMNVDLDSLMDKRNSEVNMGPRRIG